MAINTFKISLPAKQDLRKSLTSKPVTSVCQLIWIDKYKRVEEDQQKRKGKAKVILQERRDFKLDRYNNNRLGREFTRQLGFTHTQAVNAMFQEPVRQVLKKIKNKPFFKWPNKMARNPIRCN